MKCCNLTSIIVCTCLQFGCKSEENNQTLSWAEHEAASESDQDKLSDVNTLDLVNGANDTGIVEASSASINPDPYILCYGETCDSGVHRKRDSQLLIQISDTEGGHTSGTNVTLRLFDTNLTRVAYVQQFVTDSQGRWRSPKYANARGRGFELCIEDSEVYVGQGGIFVREYSGQGSCFRGALNAAGKDTVLPNIRIPRPVPVALDIADIVKTGSYCPQSPRLLSRDSLEVNLPFPYNLLKLLGICRNLDTQVYGRVVDYNNSSLGIANASVQVTFDPGTPQQLTHSYEADGDGNFVTAKVSRMRGKSVQVCARKIDYPQQCVTTTASAKDVFFIAGSPGPGSLSLVKNVAPIAFVMSGAAANSDGYFPPALIKGFAFDSDGSGSVEILIRIQNQEFQVTANQESSLACDQFGICGQPNIGFTFDPKPALLAPWIYTIDVYAGNKPVSGQPSHQQYFEQVDGSPLLIDVLFYAPPPLANDFAALSVQGVTRNSATVSLERFVAKAKENFSLTTCIVGKPAKTCVKKSGTGKKSQAITSISIGKLLPNTLYSTSATVVRAGKTQRSRLMLFKTRP